MLILRKMLLFRDGPAAAVRRITEESSVVNVVQKSLPKQVGPVAVVRLITEVNSAMSVVFPSRHWTVGLVAVAQLIRVSSVRSVARRNLRAHPCTDATDAVGNRKTPLHLLNSALNAEILLMKVILYTDCLEVSG